MSSDCQCKPQERGVGGIHNSFGGIVPPGPENPFPISDQNIEQL